MEVQLNSHQFFDEVWSKIPEDLISNQYLHENYELLKDITFEFYKDYAEDRATINYSAKKISNFFALMFKYKPLLRNIVDDYMVNSVDEYDND